MSQATMDAKRVQYLNIKNSFINIEQQVQELYTYLRTTETETPGSIPEQTVINLYFTGRALRIESEFFNDLTSTNEKSNNQNPA